MSVRVRRVLRAHARWIDAWWRCPYCLVTEGKPHATDCPWTVEEP